MIRKTQTKTTQPTKIAKIRRKLIKYLAVPGLVQLAFIAFNLYSFSAQASPLTQHPSAYLAMHADDPIKWQLWNQQTLKKAKQNDQLILISSGYFSCHWCHVMQQENYKNLQVAQVVNQSFVAVKIDRELNTQLDDYLLEFARKTTGQAGWPLHVILTPEGQPLFSFIYQPTEALINTLNQIQAWWSEDPNHLRTLAQPTESLVTEQLPINQLKPKLYQYLNENMDSFGGGLEGTQKFPNSPLLLALLMQTDLPDTLDEWLELTLEYMQSEHLYDHVYGGFFRYTVDPEWQIPHFEKMLYDNAQLVQVYFLAAERYQRHDFLNTAKQTLAYIERELISPVTGLAYSSQSAIDENQLDGGRYIWNRQQLKTILTAEEFALVHQAWLLDNPPPLDQGWLPKTLKSSDSSDHQAWLSIQHKLSNRAAITDDKQLIGWNGLLLSAYAQAYKTQAEDSILKKGQILAQQLLEILQSPAPPKAINDTGQKFNLATLEDYALSLRALKHWQAVSGDNILTEINILKSHIFQQFQYQNGWISSPQNLLPGLVAQTTLADSALPSPSAILDCKIQQLDIKFPIWRYASYLNGCDF